MLKKLKYYKNALMFAYSTLFSLLAIWIKYYYFIIDFLIINFQLA